MDPRAAFAKRFGDLVALLRADPGNDAAQELALTAAARAVAFEPVIVDATGDPGGAGGEFSLGGRMRARDIERLRVAAGADLLELLMLARALSHDVTPIPRTVTVQIDWRVARAAAPKTRSQPDRRHRTDRRRRRAHRPGAPERRTGDDRRTSGERRRPLAQQQEAGAALLLARLGQTAQARAWRETLHYAHTLLELIPRLPRVEREAAGVGMRRHLPRAALAGIVQVALGDRGEEGRAVDVLRWAGKEGAEVMLDALAAIEGAASRHFLYDALETMANAFPAAVAFLGSSAPRQIRRAAEILGRLGRPEAIGPLQRHLQHPDEQVRGAVVRALAELPIAETGEALLEALLHPSAPTRIATAEAIGRRGKEGVAMWLVAALEKEREPSAWRAMVMALATLGSPEACTALVAIALNRRTLLRPKGHPAGHRLEAVSALARVTTPAGMSALDTIARQGDARARGAALEALAAKVQVVG